MAATYTNASITIVLADGSGLDMASGTIEFLSDSRAVVDALRDLAQKNADDDWSPYQERVYEVFEKSNNFPFRPEGEVDTRGWTFQEKLLSRRIVSITKDGVFWDCFRHSSSDRRPTGILGDFSPGFRDTNDRNTRRLLAGLRRTDIGDSASDPYLLWRRLIQDYTRRDLTDGRDKLIAVEGITRRMGKLLNDKCHAGIWTADAIRSLLWFVEPSCNSLLQSRVTRNDALSSVFDAPSWSWAKVKGPVEYRLWHPHARNAAGGAETFTALARVRKITARPKGWRHFNAFDGRISIVGPCIEAWIDSDVVFVPRSAGFKLRNRVPRDTPRGALHELRHQHQTGQANIQLSTGSFHMASFIGDGDTIALMDARSGSPETRTQRDPELVETQREATEAPRTVLEAKSVKLLLLARGGYTEMAVGQHCLVLEEVEEKPGQYRRIGLCVFDVWQVCLSAPKSCPACPRPRKSRHCRGIYEMIEIE